MSYDLVLASGSPAVTYDTANQSFGSAAFAAGSYITTALGSTANNPMASLISGGKFTDGTVEFKFYRATAPSQLEVILGESGMFWLGVDNTGSLIVHIGNGPSANGTVTDMNVPVSNGNICDGAKHHIAMVNRVSDGSATIYIDGVVRASTTVNPTVYTSVYEGLVVGALQYGVNPAVYGYSLTAGSVDELAISTVRQYTAPFTPPTAAFSPARSGQIALYHFDGNAADAMGAAATAPASTGNNPLVLTNATFDTASQKFGSAALNGGWGQAPAGVFGTTGANWAVEIRFKIGSAPSSLRVMLGSAEAGSQTCYVGMNTAGQIVGNIATNNVTFTGTTNFADNSWHAAVLSAGSSGVVLLVDGAVQASTAQTQVASANAALTVGGLVSNSRSYDWPGELDEVVVWPTNRYPGAYTPQTTAYAGNEGMSALYHLDGSGTDSTKAVAPSEITILPNDGNIIYSPGGWDVTASRAKTINTGGRFRTLIQGSATALTLVFDISADATPLPQIMARVDRGPWLIQEIAASVPLVIPTGNTWASHLVEFEIKAMTETQARWNQQSTAVSFLGIAAAPTSCSTVPIYRAPMRGVVFGDSITEGVRIAQATAPSGKDTDRNDASQGWAGTLGALTGAEVGVIGFGATGWMSTGSGAVPALPNTYALLWGSGPARSFAGLDFVVINHGTNDSGYSDASVTSSVTAVLNGILAASNSVQIFAMRPFNGTKASAILAGIAACANPARVTYVDTTGWWSTSDASDSLHPYGYIDIVALAPRLAAVIRNKLRGVTNRWVRS